MNISAQTKRSLSRYGLIMLGTGIIGAISMTLLGVVLHYMAETATNGMSLTEATNLHTLSLLCDTLRIVSDALIEPGVFLFIGGKYLETRHIFSVGFDAVDSAQVRVKGPDDDNIVWIGRSYPSRFDAEIIAAAFERRLRDGAVETHS